MSSSNPKESFFDSNCLAAVNPKILVIQSILKEILSQDNSFCTYRIMSATFLTYFIRLTVVLVSP